MTSHVSTESAEGRSPAPVVPERVTYHGWPDCYRLRNADIEVVVVPAVARILRYGRVGGANLLWENGHVAGTQPHPGEWANYGGNKVWIWPQEAWPARMGHDWPPATDEPDTIVHEATPAEEGGLRLTSPPIPGFGVRTTRQLRLAPTGTRLQITSRIERLDEAADFPMAAWTVTQMPADGRILARLTPGSRLPRGYRPFESTAFSAVERALERVLVIRRPAAHWAKLGLDGDLLAWQRGADLFVERSIDGTAQLSDFRPGDRAQVYSHPDGDRQLPGARGYVELELTSPIRKLGPGEAVTLETTWELLTLGPTEQTERAVAEGLMRYDSRP